MQTPERNAEIAWLEELEKRIFQKMEQEKDVDKLMVYQESLRNIVSRKNDAINRARRSK